MRAYVIVLAALLPASCTPLFETADDVEVRLHNLSSTSFDSVTVSFPEDEHRFGHLSPGETSGYASVSEAYRYARIEAWIESESHVLQPTDFVGEDPLPGGRHTYGLTFDGEQLGIIMADEYGAQQAALFLTAAQPATEAMEALFEGRVIMDAAGCLRLDSPDPATVVWPHGFRLVSRDGERQVRDTAGRAIGTVGGQFRFGGGEVSELSASLLAHRDRAAALQRCPGRFWIVGDVR